ncbi:uncharacterized protein TNCV_3373141 [Trichonephila clavipes]|nr:uncharacterized protein TNCV_3373141 [Trichonephila clavipes]
MVTDDSMLDSIPAIATAAGAMSSDIKLVPKKKKGLPALRKVLLNEEQRRLLQHVYYAKPFLKPSWVKDWQSVTHRDYVVQYDTWSTYFPENFPNPQFTDFTCRKWCKEEHNPPLSGKICFNTV